jgi:hypothetical protein
MIRYFLHAFSPLLYLIAFVVAVAWISYRLGQGRLRFSVRGLFIMVTVVGLLAGAAKWMSGLYYWQLHDLNVVMASYPEIENVQVIGNEDVCYEVELVYFTYNGIPLQVWVPHMAAKGEIRQIVQQTIDEYGR